MANYKLDEHLSDDEIFFGKITLKEVKKRVLYEDSSKTIGCDTRKENSNDSIKIIEMHSAPDILLSHNIQPCNSSENSKSISSLNIIPGNLSADDSFLKLEKMVLENLGTSPTVDNVVNNTPAIQIYLSNSELHDSEDNKIINTPVQNNFVKNSATSQSQMCKSRISKFTPNTLRVHQKEVFSTPCSNLKTKSHVFKTPTNPVKKNFLTPSKQYQHVASPVAAYINKCPVVPLMKDVSAKKLHGISSIPKPVKHIANKENKSDVKQQIAVLPSVAYKSAKKTKVINVPDEEKLPQNQWAKQIASSIPRALVLAHNHREINSANKYHQRIEDSFDGLSLQQAELSVCTEKSAFNKLKK